jgi:hypothetical protein
LLLVALPASAATPRSQTENVLKNGATAEESWRTSHNSYTERNVDLRAEGLTWNTDRIRFFVSWATADGYCLHAKHKRMDRPMHYESKDGLPERGPCPATRDARRRWRDQMNGLLADAAVAEESHATEYGEYTTDMDDLRAQGWRNPYEEIDVFVAGVEGNTYYCLQAMHRRMDVGQFYASSEGAPRKGGCPG